MRRPSRLWFQSTPPRGGRRTGKRLPWRGQSCFNPRPHAGGDARVPRYLCIDACFNPRPHAGGDLLAFAAESRLAGFNPRPHAGGDYADCILALWSDGFNPRPHAGGDGGGGGGGSAAKGFNPRPHAGGDPYSAPQGRIPLGFNPRPHAGGDDSYSASRLGVIVSIHAPTRGATQFGLGRGQLILFQSTPPRGGRPARAAARYHVG